VANSGLTSPSRAPLVLAKIHFSAHPIAFVKVFLRDLRNEAKKTFKINSLRWGWG
jgi:hypothetical protein